MSVGGGKKSSKSWGESDSSSSSYGYQGAVSGDTSRSGSQSTSGGTSTQSIAFSDLFKQLYGNASEAAKGAAAGAGELMQHASQLFTGGQSFLQSMQDNAGMKYMQDRLSANDNLLNEQLANLKTDIGSFFNDELNPAITSNAVAGGNLGGGRQGVAQGLAAKYAGEQFTKGATALRVADQQQKDAIAGQIATNTLQAANTGLGSLPSLLDIAERGTNAELGVYSNLASILGGPTTLTQSEQFSQATAQSAADAFSKSFGEDTSKSQSHSIQGSRSSEFNFNAGLW